MDKDTVKLNVEEAQKGLQERTGQLQQSDPIFQNLVGQYNAWKVMLDSLERGSQAPNGKKSPPPGQPPPRRDKGSQRAPQEN